MVKAWSTCNSRAGLSCGFAVADCPEGPEDPEDPEDPKGRPVCVAIRVFGPDCQIWLNFCIARDSAVVVGVGGKKDA